MDIDIKQIAVETGAHSGDHSNLFEKLKKATIPSEQVYTVTGGRKSNNSYGRTITYCEGIVTIVCLAAKLSSNSGALRVS
jgi:hypothetical protein